MAIRDAILISKVGICCIVIYCGLSVILSGHIQKDLVEKQLRHALEQAPRSRPLVRRESEAIQQLKQAAEAEVPDNLEEVSVEREMRHAAGLHEEMPQWQVVAGGGEVVDLDAEFPGRAQPTEGREEDMEEEEGWEPQDSEVRREEQAKYEEFLKTLLKPAGKGSTVRAPSSWRGVEADVRASDQAEENALKSNKERHEEHRLHVPHSKHNDVQMSDSNLGNEVDKPRDYPEQRENRQTKDLSGLDNKGKALSSGNRDEPLSRVPKDVRYPQYMYNAQGAKIGRIVPKADEPVASFEAPFPGVRKVSFGNKQGKTHVWTDHEDVPSPSETKQNGTHHSNVKFPTVLQKQEHIQNDNQTVVQINNVVALPLDTINNISSSVKIPKPLNLHKDRKNLQYHSENVLEKNENGSMTHQKEQAVSSSPIINATNNTRSLSGGTRKKKKGNKKKKKIPQPMNTEDHIKVTPSVNNKMNHSYQNRAEPAKIPKPALEKSQKDGRQLQHAEVPSANVSATKPTKSRNNTYKVKLEDTCSFNQLSIDPLLDDMIDNLQKIELPTLGNYENPCWYERLPPDFQADYRTHVHMFPDQALNSFRSIIPVYAVRQQEQCPWRLRCLPLIYIIGVAKSGTSDLHSTLMSHPHVMKGATKEPFFWDTTRWKRDATISDYLNLYDEVAESIREHYVSRSGSNGKLYPYHPIVTIDSSVNALFNFDGSDRVQGYSFQGEPRYIAAHLIKNITPRAKVILIIRNPTERLFSSYIFYNTVTRPSPISAREFHMIVVDHVERLTDCFENRPFGDCLYDKAMTKVNKTVTLHAGIYYGYIKKWIDVFPDMKIIRTEDYKVNRTGVYNDLTRYIGLEPRESEVAASDYIVGKGPERTFKMWPKTRSILDNFYRPFNQLLAELLHDEKFLFLS